MTKKTTHHPIDRATLAAELRELAEQFDQGLIQTEEGAIAVGEPLFFKTKRKVKEGRAYLTFSCKIAMAAPTSVPPPPAPDKQRPPTTGMPSAAKTMKKEIARLWKEVGARISANTEPAAGDAAKLRRLVEEYRLYAPTAWAADWQACGVAINRCIEASAAGDLATARALIDTINQQTKSCHKLHK